jgi:hypothetical protein
MTSIARGDDMGTIREGIERTRAEMSRTVNAIEERLSPAHLKEQVTNVKEHVVEQIRDVKDQAKARVREATVGRVENMVHDARDKVTDAGSSVIETIKANPLPSALVAVGLGWLIMSGRSRSLEEEPYTHRYDIEDRRARRPRPRRAMAQAGHRIEEKASEISEGAKHVVHDVGESASHVARDARETGRRAARRGGRQARRAEQSFEATFRDNPLAVGMAAVAIGATIGLLLPRTEKEDQLIGKAKGRFVEKAGGAAKEAIGKVEEKAEETISRLGAGEQGRVEQQSQPDGIAGSSG